MTYFDGSGASGSDEFFRRRDEERAQAEIERLRVENAALLAEVERLRAENNVLRLDVRELSRRGMDQHSAVEAAQADAAALRGALEPFAKEADRYDPIESDDRVPAWASRFTCGQLRVARAARARAGGAS